MYRKLLATSALTGAVLLGTACTPAAQPRPAEPSLTVQADSTILAPTNIRGAVVDGRASFTWDKPADARDVVIYDVTKGQPGRVVGASSTSWTSSRLPGTSPYSFQLVARDYAKVEQTRSDVITLYPAGAPTEPTPTLEPTVTPEPTPTPTSPPPPEPTTEPPVPTEEPPPATEEPAEPSTPPTEPTEPTPTTPPPVEEPTDPTPTEPTEPSTPPMPPAEPTTSPTTDPEPETPAAQPIRTWDVDAGDSVFDVWPEIHAPSHDRVRVTTENPFPGEDASLQFTVRRGENGYPGANSTWTRGPSGTLRAEVRDSIANSGNPGEGTEQWWSWATYFPADFNWDERGQFLGFMQFHQTANSGKPPVHFWVDEQERMGLDVRGGSGGWTSGDAQYTRTFDLGPVDLGAWNDMVFRVVWSSDPNKGLIEVYRGGELALSAQAANLYAGQSAYVKQGIYSANGREVPEHTIRVSTTRLGDSLESVRPPSASD